MFQFPKSLHNVSIILWGGANNYFRAKSFPKNYGVGWLAKFAASMLFPAAVWR